MAGCWLFPARAQPPPPAATAETITDAVRIWTLPPESKSVSHPLRLEGRVSYFDPSWRMLWLEKDHVGTYVLLAGSAPVMRSGQRVLIEGQIVPDKGLAAESAAVTVLREREPVVPLSANGRINDRVTLHGRVVTADAYVDGQQYIDDDHVRLALIVDDRPVIGWVKPDDPRAIVNWTGKFIRAEGVYSARFDPTQTQTSIELWIGAQENLKVLGALDNYSLFDLPRTPIDQIASLPLGAQVLVRGRAEAQEGGQYIVIRDGTGQIVAQSIQEQRVPLGTEVEAVGRISTTGPKWILHPALFRQAAKPVAARESAIPAVFETVDGIRQLSLDEAAAGRAVHISGLVTWSLPGNDFFFLQDVSGGIRVRYDLAKMETPALGKYLAIEGVTYAGEFMPAIDLRSMKDLGSMSPPATKPVTFEQAITGKEDGQWVEMRGFIQRTESVGDSRLIHVTTPGGEFVGHLLSPVNFVANPGSLIRVRGVCEATADETGRLSGVMLRVPFLHSITIEEDAPLDYYDLPARSIKGLRQISGSREMMRVRILGTVLQDVPGRTLYVEQDGVGLQLLTRQEEIVLPGEKIEAVGILGWEGVRIVLREAVFRRLGSHAPPEPVPLADPAKLDPALDARLVRVRGTLIDASQQHNYTRLTMQAGPTLFEAHLEQRPAGREVALHVGAGLELTGIYQLGFDDSRQTRSFALQLRSPDDIVVYQAPRVWTLQRALLALAVLGGCTLLGVAWITALRRRVRKQTGQIREQMERQARLEAEVQRSARLESLGVLAGGIAHDFNNLLTIIMGNLGLAQLDEKLTPSTAHCLSEIERGAVRAQTLTRQLLTFAKGGEPVRAPLSMPELVRAVTEGALQGSNVRCEFANAPDLWLAHADKNQLAQVVQSLVLNAQQAMAGGGTLRIALRNDQISAGTKLPLPAGRFVRISVSDTGEGIRPEVIPRIFDPYFSTRRSGSGLGLATVYSIVKRHQGAIEVHSTPGVGTTFDLWLPAAETTEPKAEAPVAFPLVARPAAENTPRVLVMDDEQSIRQVAAAVLQRMGLNPTVVADGSAAIREFSIAQHAGQPFDLLILDLTIVGGMGGKEVIDLIRKLDVQVPAIVSSGYSSDPVMANFGSYGFQAVVPKPYEIGQLATVVNGLLGRSEN